MSSLSKQRGEGNYDGMTSQWALAVASMAAMAAPTITMTNQNRIKLHTFFLVLLPRPWTCLVAGKIITAFHVAHLNSHHRHLHFLMEIPADVAMTVLLRVAPPAAMPSFSAP